MKYDFGEEVLEKHVQENYGTWRNAIRIKSGTKLMSDMTEILYAEYTGGIVMNAEGYDVLIDDEVKDELKSTDKMQAGRHLRIAGLKGKEGKCDNIVIIDLINNRTSRIPSEVFFAEAKIYKSANHHEFRWSADYETGTVAKASTQLFLKYEVK